MTGFENLSPIVFHPNMSKILASLRPEPNYRAVLRRFRASVLSEEIDQRQHEALCAIGRAAYLKEACE